MKPEEKLETEVTLRFKKLLKSWAWLRGWRLGCVGMRCVIDSLVTLIKKGADKIYGDRVLVALAGFENDRAWDALTMTAVFPPAGFEDPEKLGEKVAKKKEHILNRSASWLAHNPLWSRVLGHKSVMSCEEARELLPRLYAEYFS